MFNLLESFLVLLWDYVHWWLIFFFLLFLVTGVLFPEKKKGRTASGDSYPYER